MMDSVTGTFEGENGFCCNCGSILPTLGDSGAIKCYTCKSEYEPEVFGAMLNHYEIGFNTRRVDRPQDQADSQRTSSGVSDGPIVERKCNKCGNDTMSYAAVQMRSVDEGQTVFYTCTRCGYKEVENS